MQRRNWAVRVGIVDQPKVEKLLMSAREGSLSGLGKLEVLGWIEPGVIILCVADAEIDRLATILGREKVKICQFCLAIEGDQWFEVPATTYFGVSCDVTKVPYLPGGQKLTLRGESLELVREMAGIILAEPLQASSPTVVA